VAKYLSAHYISIGSMFLAVSGVRTAQKITMIKPTCSVGFIMVVQVKNNWNQIITELITWSKVLKDYHISAQSTTPVY
jgi:formate hydrogenlyase subunit 4